MDLADLRPRRLLRLARMDRETRPRLALALASLAASSAVAALQPAGEVRNLALLTALGSVAAVVTALVPDVRGTRGDSWRPTLVIAGGVLLWGAVANPAGPSPVSGSGSRPAASPTPAVRRATPAPAPTRILPSAPSSLAGAAIALVDGCVARPAAGPPGGPAAASGDPTLVALAGLIATPGLGFRTHVTGTVLLRKQSSAVDWTFDVEGANYRGLYIGPGESTEVACVDGVAYVSFGGAWRISGLDDARTTTLLDPWRLLGPVVDLRPSTAATATAGEARYQSAARVSFGVGLQGRSYQLVGTERLAVLAASSGTPRSMEVVGVSEELGADLFATLRFDFDSVGVHGPVARPAGAPSLPPVRQ